MMRPARARTVLFPGDQLAACPLCAATAAGLAATPLSSTICDASGQPAKLGAHVPADSASGLPVIGPRAVGRGRLRHCDARALPRPTAPSREVLPNGVRVVIQEHRTSDIVVLQLWVGVGGRDEAPEERGFSHFAEHMLFKGTETLGRGFVDREIEAVGGRTNAATSYDYTYYYVLLPAARAARGIEMLADIAVNSRFDTDELGHEREVVFEEIRLGEDNPRAALHRRLYD